MSQRHPRTATRSSALPSLAALLASGVVVDGCAADDATARRERLSSHGENAASALDGHRVSDALREIGVGLGLIDAPPQYMTPGGAPPPVTVEPPMATGGAVAPVQPTPPPQPQTPVAHPAGGPMRIAPVPPPPPAPPVLPPPLVGSPTGTEDLHLGRAGGIRAVAPHPPPTHRR
ncbi:MAG: hypothetical protein JWM10_5306 [Myxococcaceae bacterium]|nr:hypothetical protein [Myxococcaceae bacterium]